MIILRCFLGATLFLSCTGCNAIDPLYRDGLWRPSGANADNLAAMVDVPSDLVRGAGRPGAGADVPVDAIDRYRHDRVRALPTVATSTVSAAGGGDNGGGPGGSGPGGGAGGGPAAGP